LRTRSDVPIVNIVPVETMITKVKVEGKPQTIVLPIIPMFMQLSHNISLPVYSGDGSAGVRMSKRGGKRSRPLGRSAAAIAAQALPESGRDAEAKAGREVPGKAR
jgi:hypothetical protein